MKVANYEQHEKISDYYKELHQIIEDNKLNYKVMGKVEKYEIGLITPKKFIKNRPNILITAGFHGDELGGTHGLLEFLRSKEIPKDVNVSFIPIVNPTGYMMDTRENYMKENPNRNFTKVNGNEDKVEPSKEGKILMKNLEDILFYSKDGFLTLHEDMDKRKYYIYVTDSLEDKENPKLLNLLKRTMSKHFEIDNSKKIEGDDADGGIVRYSFCGAFDDLLFIRGVTRVICTETPGKLDIEDRIKANVDIISKFISFYSSI